MTLAAVIAVSLLAILAVFQVALALGAPWGDMSWGGRHPGVLPMRLRVASAVAGLVVYPVIGLVILASAGVIAERWVSVAPSALWVLTAFFLLGTLANAASRSHRERIWAPVSLVIAICCGVIALGL